MRTYHAAVLILVGILVLSGCTTTLHHATHPSFETDAAPMKSPRRVALLPVKVAIYEIGAGGSVEEVPQWSREGFRLVDGKVKDKLAMQSGIQLVIAPELSEESRQLLEQHRALYEQVAANRLQIRNIPAWKSKIEHPDDTVGSGMAPLKDALGADTVLFLSGYDYCASGGRVAAFIFAALFGAVVPMGHSMVHVGLVDLETGNILWTDTVYSEDKSLKNEADVDALVDLAFFGFPEPPQTEDAHAQAR